VNLPLLVAGALALVAAAVHGLGGELLVLRRFSPRALPRTPFGGPAMTMTMIRVTWHITTIAFVELAILDIYAPVVSGGAGRDVEWLAAGTSTAFAAWAMGAGLRQGPAALLRHRGPLALATIAGLTWWGTL
jgi:hypothetical protein